MVPRHSFHLWLSILGRLQTRCRLHQLGICTDCSCCICAINDEDIAHLYWQCPYSSIAKNMVQDWLKIRLPDIFTWQWCVQLKRRSKLQWRVVLACVAGLMYLIWQARNDARVNQVLPTPAALVQQLQKTMCCRIRGKIHVPLLRKDQVWLKDRNLL
ncbi:uncharacterized protein LOC141631998 [Silene latifolia]|uniref:uncharacterized protein LOC141631998 n=1 Tax=Silene latifolia TaxID=37657 RepID=UPI003D76A7D6